VWTANLPDGRKVKASLLIELFQGKTLTTKNRKFYFALYKIYEEDGWNEQERTLTSAYRITETLGLKWAGKKSIGEIRTQYRQLSLTPMIWEFSWINEKGE